MCSARRASLVLSVGAVIVSAPRPAAADPTPITPQLAYTYGENETPRAAGMGGALRSLGNSTAAIFLNPAAMVETRVYHVEGIAQVSPEARRYTFGGVVSDSVTGRLAGSIALVGGFIDPDGIDRSFLDARLALAYPITEHLFIGLTGKYSRIYQEGTLAEGGLGDSAASGGLRDPDDTGGGYLPIVDEFSFDAGLVLKVSDSVYLSAVGQNLTYPGTGLLPTTVGGGVGIGTTDFSLEADALADLNSYLSASMRLMIGGEYLVANHIPIRLGYRFDQGAGEHSLSGGLGYVGNEFAIEASVRRALADPGATSIFLGLSYHLDAAGLTRSPADL